MKRFGSNLVSDSGIGELARSWNEFSFQAV